MIRVDRPSGRAHNNLTGTLRPYRGRGLATVLKSHSLHRAAALGATIAVTDNDETNAPMLAVNAKLGYRPFARRLIWERRSGTCSSAS
jgi:GNAT superfamily N-acetyltransferase